MNFLSKLIIICVISLIVSVTFIIISINDLKTIQLDLNNKIKTIDKRVNFIATNNTKKDVKETSFGIDISHWNGDVLSYLPMKKDISFVVCKATQGIRFVDPDFKTNWVAIKEMNKIRGAYHLYIYGEDPEAQANHFCNVVSDLNEKDMPLILDIEELSLPKTEVDSYKLKDDVIKFLEVIESRINRVPIIYTDYSFADKYLNYTKFSRYPLWLAEYSNSKKPIIPIPWKIKGCMIWQKKRTYTINSTTVDFDEFFGKKEDIVK